MALDEVKRLETHYPDGLKQLVVINGKTIWVDTLNYSWFTCVNRHEYAMSDENYFHTAPKVAKLAYKIVKPFVNENTIKRVKLFPKLNAKVKKFMEQFVDLDQLPEKYGGNKKTEVLDIVNKTKAFEML